MARTGWRFFQRTFAAAPKPVNHVARFREYLSSLDKDLVVPSFKKAVLHSDRVAVKDSFGEYTYFQLFMGAKNLSFQISNICGSAASANVAYFGNNTVMSPLIQWSCWISGQAVVPLQPTFPTEQLKFIIRDTDARLIITTPEYEEISKALAKDFQLPLVIINNEFIEPYDDKRDSLERQILIGKNERIMLAGTLEHNFYGRSNAMILYPSNAAGGQKAVVLTHKNIARQVDSLITAWDFTDKDSLLLVMPLNQSHSFTNLMLGMLSVGAKVNMLDQFNSHTVWKTLLGINIALKDRANLFMAVPSVYSQLLATYADTFAKNTQMVEYIKNFCKTQVRLMASGSAALPAADFKQWQHITGHKIVEHYGMSEVGIALSNPCLEETNRRQLVRQPETIGIPLPGVTARIVNEQQEVLFSCDGDDYLDCWKANEKEAKEAPSACPEFQQLPPATITGELELSGHQVFKEYHKLPELTKSLLQEDFFKTGDKVSFENGVFKFQGRMQNNAVIPVGYEVDTAEIESVLLTHPNIEHALVLGVPDGKSGERVAAVCVLRPNTDLSLEELARFCSAYLPAYKHPTILKTVKQLPKGLDDKSQIKEELGDVTSEQELSIRQP